MNSELRVIWLEDDRKVKAESLKVQHGYDTFKYSDVRMPNFDVFEIFSTE